MSALWGQLSCYLLLNLSDKAFETFVKLKDNIDSLVIWYLMIRSIQFINVIQELG